MSWTKSCRQRKQIPPTFWIIQPRPHEVEFKINPRIVRQWYLNLKWHFVEVQNDHYGCRVSIWNDCRLHLQWLVAVTSDCLSPSSSLPSQQNPHSDSFKVTIRFCQIQTNPATKVFHTNCLGSICGKSRAAFKPPHLMKRPCKHVLDLCVHANLRSFYDRFRALRMKHAASGHELNGWPWGRDRAVDL